MKTIDIKAPYLIFLGNETEITYAKTGAGLVRWRPELCKGQIRLAADKGGANLIDIRVHPETMPIGSGKKRSGKRLLTVGIGKQVNPDIRCVGISVNTSTLPEEEREAHLNNLSAELCLPCVDPIAGDSKPIIDNLSGV